ncbi:hypothetical protein ACN28I_17805 [Archangium gephyra]|uniref:hypothetical protein n=1 Tax=Archangium gephyra TaxID=48 RepID=UPI003B780E24
MNKTMTAVGVDMTLDQIRDTINALARQGSTANHQIGVLYNHVVDRRLAEIAGYKSTQDYFIAHVKALAQSTLSLYGTVARNFTESVCTQHGMGNLREAPPLRGRGQHLHPGGPGAHEHPGAAGGRQGGDEALLRVQRG